MEGSGRKNLALPAAPSITTQPNVSSGAGRWDSSTILKAITGLSSTISLTASGSGLSYQWYRNGSLWAGKTSSSFTLSGAAGDTDAVSDAAFYYCTVTNPSGSATSTTLSLSCLFFETNTISCAFASGLTSISAKIWGSGGASSADDTGASIAGAYGGGGGYSTGVFNLTGFSTSYHLQMTIGATGASTAFYTTDAGSAIVSTIVAGGGGRAATTGANPAAAGGGGGGTTGNDGDVFNQAGYNGKGGTSSAGGAGATADAGHGAPAGGAGGGPSSIGASNGGTPANFNAGPGGSGYYGGGSGTWAPGFDLKGGGGGGSGVTTNVTSSSMSNGTNAGVPGNSGDAQRYTSAGSSPSPSTGGNGFSGCVCITPVS